MKPLFWLFPQGLTFSLISAKTAHIWATTELQSAAKRALELTSSLFWRLTGFLGHKEVFPLLMLPPQLYDDSPVFSHLQVLGLLPPTYQDTNQDNIFASQQNIQCVLIRMHVVFDWRTLSDELGVMSLYKWFARWRMDSTSGCLASTSWMSCDNVWTWKCYAHRSPHTHLSMCVCVCVLHRAGVPLDCAPAEFWFWTPSRTDSPTEPEAHPVPSADTQSPAVVQAEPWTPKEGQRRFMESYRSTAWPQHWNVKILL